MQSNKIKLGETLYNYFEFPNSDKPKILLLHGLKVESHCWEEIISIIKNDFHIFALDLKGHGETEHGKVHDPDYTLAQISSEINEFYNKIIKDSFHIAGYSLGGQYALNYASNYPQTLKSLILLDSAPEISLKGFFFLVIAGGGKNKIYKSKEEIIQLTEKYGFGKIGKYLTDYTLKIRDDARYEYKFDQKNISPKTLIAYRKRANELWENLKSIKTKTLLIKAEKSQIINNFIVKRMKNLLLSMAVEVIPKVGHEMIFTAPKEVADKLIQFIK